MAQDYVTLKCVTVYFVPDLDLERAREYFLRWMNTNGQ